MNESRNTDTFTRKARSIIVKEIKQVHDAEKHFWDNFGNVLHNSWKRISELSGARSESKGYIATLEEIVLIHKAMDIYLDPSFSLHVFLEMQDLPDLFFHEALMDRLKHMQCEELRPFVEFIAH